MDFIDMHTVKPEKKYIDLSKIISVFLNGLFLGTCYSILRLGIVTFLTIILFKIFHIILYWK